MGFTVIAKKVKLVAIHKGIRIHQYLDDWFGESQISPNLSPAYSGTSRDLPETRLASEHREIRAGFQASL